MPSQERHYRQWYCLLHRKSPPPAGALAKLRRLREAQVLIEQWRRHFNTVRPHSALGYRPPAPEVAMPTLAMPPPRKGPAGSSPPPAGVLD